MKLSQVLWPGAAELLHFCLLGRFDLCDADVACVKQCFNILIRMCVDYVKVAAVVPSSLAYGPPSLQYNQCLLQNDRHIYLPFAVFLHLLTSVDFRSFSVQSEHLNFGLPSFLLTSGFPRNTFITVLSSDILSTWPAHSGLLIVIVVALFGILYKTCRLSLFGILQPCP